MLVGPAGYCRERKERGSVHESGILFGCRARRKARAVCRWPRGMCVHLVCGSVRIGKVRPKEKQKGREREEMQDRGLVDMEMLY